MARFTALLAAVALLATGSVGATTPTVNARDATPTSIPADLINLLLTGIFKNINPIITLNCDSLFSNIIETTFNVTNPLPVELTIDTLAAKAGLNGTTFATFTHTFNPALVVPPLGTMNTGLIKNVSLPQGLIATLNIIPFGILDLPDSDANVRLFTIGGLLGLPLALTGLNQTSVPANYTFSLD